MPAATAEPKQLRDLHIELKVKQPPLAPAKGVIDKECDCVRSASRSMC